MSSLRNDAPGDGSPGAVESLYATGHWLLNQGRYRDAAVVFRVMMLCVPTDERAWLALGTCHEHIDQRLIALELYGAGAVVASRTARCLVSKARVLKNLARDDEADAALDQAQLSAEAADEDDLVHIIERERTLP